MLHTIDGDASACAEVFLSLFANRLDVVYVEGAKGKPVCRRGLQGGDLRKLLEAHLGNPKGPRVGVPALSAESTSKWICIDFDGCGHSHPLQDPLGAARQALSAAESAGLVAHLEMSGGGSGWHVWLFFDEPIPAVEARTLGMLLVPTDARLVDGSLANAAKGQGVEIFPKQTSIAKDGVGSMVWLPCAASRPSPRSRFHTDEGEVLS